MPFDADGWQQPERPEEEPTVPQAEELPIWFFLAILFIAGIFWWVEFSVRLWRRRS